MKVTPVDGNSHADGLTNFSRAYSEGTIVSVTAPLLSNGRKFVRWSVNGVLQDLDARTLTLTATEDITLKAYYKRQGRIAPDDPRDGGGDLD